jgi:hypothetical protein
LGLGFFGVIQNFLNAPEVGQFGAQIFENDSTEDVKGYEDERVADGFSENE